MGTVRYRERSKGGGGHRSQGTAGAEARQECPERYVGPRGEPTLDPAQNQQQNDKPVVSTLLVPFTPGSSLQKLMQENEDKLCTLTGGPMVRVVEKGGEVLSNLLGRSDPWAAARSCRDPKCPTCATRSWPKEQKKLARKAGTKLPSKLVQTSVPNCRREGATYTLQCLECLGQDKSSLYHGESSRSPRQHHLEHVQDLQNGSIASPLVTHAIQEHGLQVTHVPVPDTSPGAQTIVQGCS